MWICGPGSEVGLEGERLVKWHPTHGGAQWASQHGVSLCV